MAEKKVSVLLTVIDKQNFSLLRNLVAPGTPKDKSFDDLTALLKTHFEPKKLVIAECLNYYGWDQHNGESIMDFVRRLTLNCEFKTFLDQALRDRFVCGLKCESMQKHLLSEDKKLTFSRAVNIAQGVESAESKAKEFKGLQLVVFQVMSKHKGEKKPCHRCGRSNHSEQMCRFRQAMYHNCGKVGHIAPFTPMESSPIGKPPESMTFLSSLMVNDFC